MSIEMDIDKCLAGKPQKHRMPGFEKTENSIKSILNRRKSVPRVETIAGVKNDLRA